MKLYEPTRNTSLTVMQAFAKRASIRDWSDRYVNLSDLSDILWVANGVNRPESGRRTAPSAMNAQDVEVYVFTTTGVYRYDAGHHELLEIHDGDHRKEIGVRNKDKSLAPLAQIELVLVSDTTRFPFESETLRNETGCLDVGMVSQNISLYCAANGLATCPRAYIDSGNIARFLNLKDGQRALLDHPIAHPGN